MSGVCRVGDIVTGTCLNHHDPVSFTGTWDTNTTNVNADSISVIRQGDLGSTDCGHKFAANGSSSSNVQANNFRLQRVGDSVTVIGGGSGTSITGSSNVTSI